MLLIAWRSEFSTIEYHRVNHEAVYLGELFLVQGRVAGRRDTAWQVAPILRLWDAARL